MPLEEWWGKEPKRHKAHKVTYPVKTQYVTHQARADVGKKITKLINKIAGEGDFVSTIGWTTDDLDEGGEKEAMIIADPSHYRGLSHEASRLLKGTESQKDNLAYSSMRFMKGNLLAELVDKESKGKKVLWCWAAAGSTVFMKMGGSKYFNLHSALIEWEGEPNIIFRSSTDDLHGFCITRSRGWRRPPTMTSSCWKRWACGQEAPRPQKRNPPPRKKSRWGRTRRKTFLRYTRLISGSITRLPKEGKDGGGSETQFRCKISTVGGAFKTGLAYAAQGAGTHDNEGCRR